MITLDMIKDKFGLEDLPPAHDWPLNAPNYWVFRQSLINKGKVAVEFYAECMREKYPDMIIQTDGVKQTAEYDCIFFTLNDGQIIDSCHKEVKMATVPDSLGPDDFVRLNQIRKDQMWKSLVAVLVFSNRVEIYEISKDKYKAKLLNNENTRIVKIAGNNNAIQMDFKYKIFQEDFTKIL